MFSVCRHYKDSGRKSPVGGGQVHTVKILSSLAEGGHYDLIMLSLRRASSRAAAERRITEITPGRGGLRFSKPARTLSLKEPP